MGVNFYSYQSLITTIEKEVTNFGKGWDGNWPTWYLSKKVCSIICGEWPVTCNLRLKYDN